MQSKRTMIPRVCEHCGTPFLAHPPDVRRGFGRFCSRQCGALSRRHTPEDFWVRVEQSDGCWLWTGQRDKDGYGHVWYGGIGQVASRLAWELTHGPIPAGYFALHSCDNPPCCRPDHLFLGTSRDNIDDMLSKGRQTSGERNGRAKLTLDQVGEIRRRYATEHIRQVDLGREYGVTQTQISVITRGEQWRL